MNCIGEASFVLCVEINLDISRAILGLSQKAYVGCIKGFDMKNVYLTTVVKAIDLSKSISKEQY